MFKSKEIKVYTKYIVIFDTWKHDSMSYNFNFTIRNNKLVSILAQDVILLFSYDIRMLRNFNSYTPSYDDADDVKNHVLHHEYIIKFNT